MSSNTPNLGLLKKDPMVDGNETFNIETMLNENWDKIDEAVGQVREDLGNIDVDIPDASLTQKGIVQLSSATNGARENVAATEKAVKMAYDRGSEGVTVAAAAQAKADAAETPAGAQSKANAAENNANAYVDAKPWQRVKVTDDAGWAINIGAQDLNTPRKTGWYMGSGMANAPGAGWYYIEVIRHNDSWEVQNAYDFNGSGSFQQRKKQNGVWTAWTQDLFTSVANGKQAIASAISGKGVPASGSDEFAVLANKISQINIGIRTVVTASENSASIYSGPWSSGNPYVVISTRELFTIPEGKNFVDMLSNGGDLSYVYIISSYVTNNSQYNSRVYTKFRLVDRNGLRYDITNMNSLHTFEPYLRFYLQSFFINRETGAVLGNTIYDTGNSYGNRYNISTTLPMAFDKQGPIRFFIEFTHDSPGSVTASYRSQANGIAICT